MALKTNLVDMYPKFYKDEYEIFWIELMEREFNATNELKKYFDSQTEYFGGFWHNYYYISRMLSHSFYPNADKAFKQYIIVDVGSACGPQWVFFKDFLGYISVDMFDMQSSYPYSHMVHIVGRFGDVIPQIQQSIDELEKTNVLHTNIKKLNIKHPIVEVFGISSMSLNYFADEKERMLFDKFFQNKITI